MARMIPTSLANIPTTTAGERKLFDLMKKILPDSCIVRYEMLLGEKDRRPDYVIIDPDRGIFIVEVKDWGVESIHRASKEQFYIKGFHGSSLPRPQVNPDLKCQIYLGEMREHLVAMPGLRDKKLNLKMNTVYLIAFPNITQDEFISKKLDELIPLQNVLLKQDLESTGKNFLERYNSAIKLLSKPLSPQQLSEITTALLPEIVIPTITPSAFIEAKEDIILPEKASIKPVSLSIDQEEIAKSLGEGPRLLRGIAGSGKTLIMLYRAKLTAANQPEARVLILCWNTALANYMRQAYDEFQFESKGMVEIKHFTQFIREHFNLTEPEDGWDAPTVMESIRKKKIIDKDKYDAVYIDEAQDFRQDWIEYIYNNLINGEPKSRNLIIAADDAQRIYKNRDVTWANLGIPMVGRSKILRTIYRNSARVWVFSAFLLEDRASYRTESQDKLLFAEKGGYDPQLIRCKNLDAQIDKAISIIEKLIKTGKSPRNVLILYRQKHVNVGDHQKFMLIERLCEKLDTHNIPYDWIAQDPLAKRSFDWVAEKVKISTVASAKGMDCPVVILLGAETFQLNPYDEVNDETSLMYVALTRAREFLVVLYSGDQGMVPQLQHCMDEYLEHRDAIIHLEVQKS